MAIFTLFMSVALMASPVRKTKKARRDTEDAARAIVFFKSNRSKALTLEERVDVHALQANLRMDNAIILRKEPVANRIARLLCRSNKTYGEVWSTFLSHSTVLTAAAPANRGGGAVMHLLAEKKYLSVDAAIDDSNNAALRTVQRFLKKSGYARGAHKGKTLRLAPANDLARAEYVHKMTSSEILLHRVVYMDESYIHHHYSRHNDSLVDPTDDEYVKEKHKGRRLCFIAAILDKDRTVSDEERTPEQAAELLPESVDVFEGGQQKADYHGMFCCDSFVNWMDTPLQALDNRGFTG
ncbi:unnamed protein product [Phytophthora fragariaefolia]|uniref:Unnamed protein product n=1 Tax=Phytophthora fragariaefolia TaxID=1490495 RepID=A0A9W7D2I7_9STRA|nr:unnamed protein product [Phytophthora fragariaefolia]